VDSWEIEIHTGLKNITGIINPFSARSDLSWYFPIQQRQEDKNSGFIWRILIRSPDFTMVYDDTDTGILKR
jgi:hypothetical protein